jgi:hypothetical protein
VSASLQRCALDHLLDDFRETLLDDALHHFAEGGVQIERRAGGGHTTLLQLR